MSQPGPAQMELIRRYARTMRELHADAMRARGPRIGARERRLASQERFGSARKAAEAFPGGPPSVPAA